MTIGIGTAQKDSELSLEDEIAIAYEGLEKGQTPDEVDDDLEQLKSELSEEDGAPGEGKRESEQQEEPETGGDQEATESEKADGEEEEASPSEDSLEAPQHWATEDKEIFGKVPRDAQEFLLKRHKAMEADYTRKTQEISDIRRTHDAIEKELEPISQDLALAGADSLAFIRQQVAWANAFKQDPNAALVRLAQVYGVQMPQQQPEDEEEVDPTVAQLRQEIADLRQGQTRQVEAQQQSEQTRINEMIKTFADAKAEDGSPQHPHFEAAQVTMGQLITAGLATGLEDAYPKAVNMLGLQAPEPEKKIEPESEPEPEVKPNGEDREDRIAKVRRAKRAAAGVRSSGVPAKERTGGNLTLHDEIASVWDSLENA